jgi:hypothetical protein
MLILLIHNDGTGANNNANYDVEVRVNERLIWQGRVEGHNRDDGWPMLLRQLADVAARSND